MIKRWGIVMVVCFFLGSSLSQAQGIKDGNGKMTLPDGSVYEGQFRDGAFEGKGTLTYVNGEQYVGDFKYGLYDGRGVLVYTDGTKYKGSFKKGDFDSAVPSTTVNNPAGSGAPLSNA